MIYPQGNNSSAGGSAGRRAGKNNTLTEKKGVARKNGKGGKPQQVVQWKQKNVEEGIVVVDEQQLSKLIKREPIEKYYKLDPKPFATGLFASVRRCVSRDTGEPYAAKFSSRARYGEDCSAEIHHEIALLSLCSPSPRIVKLHDVFETPTEIIILMQFAPGGDLQTVIDDNLVPFEADVVNFIRQLVEGLAYLHERKIAHLDIKPQNLVMMGDFPNCDIKLCDFEISRVILEGTEIREILGTPDYVAPEILHYEPITLSADLWSLGVTTYVLLTGFSPFGGETDQETFCNISRAQLDFPDELFEDVSEDAKDFIQQVLVRDPSARPTAKALLRHRWLSTHNAPKHRNSSPDTQKVTISDTNGRSHNVSEKNLRKYLSKSREALFERVVQQQNQHKHDLRKTTLLSQYNKTRMCESHMSLVSKTREDRPLINLSPSFSRSREKLYGLRSLSRSHEGLDLVKLSGQRSESQGTLRTYTRATTADLSMLPLLRLKENLNESDDSISGAEKNEDISTTPDKIDTATEDDFKREDCPVTQIYVNRKAEPVERIFRKNNSESSISIGSLLSPTLLKNTMENSSNLTRTSHIDESPLVTKNNTQNVILNNNQVPLDEENTLVSNTTPLELENNEDKVDSSIHSNIFQNENGTTIDTMEKLSDGVCENIVDSPVGDISIEENELISEKIPEPESTCIDEINGEPEPEVSTTNSSETNPSNIEGEEEIEEPTFTVAQLISAYNRHQEIVTKTSLEVTMTSSDKSTKLPPPIIAEDPSTKFPTGPTALRLFIPDIDIETTKKTKKNKTKSYRTLARSSTQCSVETNSTDDLNSVEGDFNAYETENTEAEDLNARDEVTRVSGDFNAGDEVSTDGDALIGGTNGDILKDLDETNNNIGYTTVNSVCTFVLDPPSYDKLDKQNSDPTNKRSSIEINPNFLRSASLSSETSGGLTPSETSSSMSWDEVNVAATVDPNDEGHWTNRKTPNHQKPKNVIVDGVNPWGKLCTGSYTRAMEKFGGKNEIITDIKTDIPARKCSLTMLFPVKQDLEEKVRRKSTSIMKLS